MGSRVETGPPAAPGGSVRYFLLLYTPRAQRQSLATLLAVADELDAGLARRLDHEVAHVRLNWWQQEAERSARGAPQHPWLLGLAERERASLQLAELVQAAGVDLARAFLGGAGEERLAQARFASAAELLTGRALTAEERAQLERLGQWTKQLERFAAAPPANDATPPRTALPPVGSAHIAAALQPALTPLLVWTALIVRHARRHARRTSGARAARSQTMQASRFDAFVDNFVAWQAARRAARGQFRIPAP
jgi:hypothetical protein